MKPSLKLKHGEFDGEAHGRLSAVLLVAYALVSRLAWLVLMIIVFIRPDLVPIVLQMMRSSCLRLIV
jgi:hypothetical protein